MSSAAQSIVLVALLIGCDGRPVGGPVDGQANGDERVVHRDSAEIAIVENKAPRWEAGTGWTVTAEPRFSIGETEGEAPYLLDRVFGAARLEDGRIVVADGGSAQLRFYDPSGTYLHAAGGRGDGPGEFRRPVALHRLPGDSIVVWEAGFGPGTVFASDGRFERRAAFPDPDEVVEALLGLPGCRSEHQSHLPDGSVIVYTYPCGDEWDSGIRPGEVYRLPVTLVRMTRDLSRIDTLGSFRALPRMDLEIDGARVSSSPVSGPLLGGPGVVIGGVAETDVMVTAIATDGELRVYAGDGDPFEIRVFRMIDGLERIIRRVDPPVRLAPEDRTLAIPQAMGGGSALQEHLARVRRVVEAMPRPEFFRPYFRLHVDTEGHIWVSGRGNGTHVFDPGGTWLGEVDLPETLERSPFLEIGRDYILALTWDSLLVERVEMWGLERMP